MDSSFNFCPECGTQNLQLREFCGNCGFSSTSSRPSPVSSTPQDPAPSPKVAQPPAQPAEKKAPSPQVARPEPQRPEGSSGWRIAEVVLWIAVVFCGLWSAEGGFDKIQVVSGFRIYDCGTALEARLPGTGDVPDACTNSDVYSRAKNVFNLAVLGALVFGGLAVFCGSEKDKQAEG